MKSYLSALFLFCAVFTLNAQNKGKWQAGVTVTPAFSKIDYNKEIYRQTLHLRPFLSGGVKARYFLRENLVLSTGIIYLCNGSGFEVTYDGPFQPEGTGGSTEEGAYRFKSVGIPVGANWLFKNHGKVRLSLGLEVMNAVTFKSEAEVISLPEDDPNRLTELEINDEHFLAVSPNMGIEFHLTERLVLLASPGFNYEVIADKTADIKYRLIGFGSEIGLYLNL